MKEMLGEGPNDFQELLNLVGKGQCKITIEPLEGEKLRTAKQNKAYQKGCAIAASRLTEGGWTRNKMFEIRQVELPYSQESFQEDITKPFMQIAYQKKSSTQLSTAEISQMWSKIRDQILVSTTNSELGGSVDIGPFPDLKHPI